MTYALGTSAATVRQAPLLLVELDTAEGVAGHAYQFCYRQAAAPAIITFLDDIADALRNDTLRPGDVWARLSKRYTLIGVQGIVRMAMSMVDVASWDALAKAAGVPLVQLLGGARRRIPAYNSNGLGLMDPGPLADEAEKLLGGGFHAVKLRLGYPTLEADVAAVRAVRDRVGPRVAIMADYNQALSVDAAIQRGQALDGEGVYWIEEPIRHDDFAGCAAVAAAVSTPIQIGENFSQVYDMEKALAARSSDFVMPDLERIGGVTGWQRASTLAESSGLSMSSHLYPEVSAHLLGVTPTAHWLEYVDWAHPLLLNPPQLDAGHVLPADAPGAGLEWDSDAVRRYRV
jgi:mandelate racemase